MGTTTPAARRGDWLIGREVASAFLVVLLLVTVMAVAQASVLQIPGCLVLVGFELVQNPLFPGLSGSAFTAAVAIYLYGLAVVLGNLYRLGRRRFSSLPVES